MTGHGIAASKYNGTILLLISTEIEINRAPPYTEQEVADMCLYDARYADIATIGKIVFGGGFGHMTFGIDRKRHEKRNPNVSRKVFSMVYGAAARDAVMHFSDMFEKNEIKIRKAAITCMTGHRTVRDIRRGITSLRSECIKIMTAYSDAVFDVVFWRELKKLMK